MELGKGLGDFWKERKKDPSALPKLRKKLESKLLPVPGTDVLMCKTEMTVGEWKLYLRAEGLTDWNQPEPDQYMQTEEHPVVKISWEAAKAFCAWLSAKSGEEWRLPTNAEWDAAVGTSTYPWGEYFPPHWDDGNYAILESGKDDPNHVGLDGIFGTAPVATFKPNALGFYDLGGNASEWMWDGFHEKTGYHLLRGASWFQGGAVSRSSSRLRPAPISKYVHDGFRLVRRPTP
jgi:formylglycine-generating enzyme required for sulfatase activity